MEFSPKELGELLDDWAASARAIIVETVQAITASGLSADDARGLAVRLDGMRWAVSIVDGAHTPTGIGELDIEMGPFIATIEKPTTSLSFVTCIGFAASLASGAATGVCQLARTSVSFATGLALFCPWGSGDVFSPSTETKSPLDLVREGSENRVVPGDIRKWLLRTEVTEEAWSDPAFRTFADAAASALIRSIASEVLGRNRLAFNGPPRLSVEMPDGSALDDLQRRGFQALQASAAWVYQHKSSAEQRHALYAAEFARMVSHRDALWDAVSSSGQDILTGARMAYSLSQADLSREAIKAQADLRKSIAEDMAKAADSTRTLATAIAVAIATGVGLMAARSTSTTEPWVLTAIASIVAVYLLVVAISGWMYISLQKRLREQWRQRFYRFVPEEDYIAMVTKPAQAATLPYHLVGAAAVVISFALLFVAVAGSDPATPSADTSSRNERLTLQFA